MKALNTIAENRRGAMKPFAEKFGEATLALGCDPHQSLDLHLNYQMLPKRKREIDQELKKERVLAWFGIQDKQYNVAKRDVNTRLSTLLL